MRRLQLGAIGIGAVLVLIGLASIIQEGAQKSDRATVAEAVSSPQPDVSTAAPDPLAQAGVVPEMPASPAAGGSTPASPTAKAPAEDAR